MKRNEMTMKEFCMRYPMSEVIYTSVNDNSNELVEKFIYSRSILYKEFGENAVIAFNELNMREETEYAKKIDSKEKTNNIFEMLDVEIDGKKCYGDDSALNELTQRQFIELASCLRNFKLGKIIM